MKLLQGYFQGYFHLTKKPHLNIYSNLPDMTLLTLLIRRYCFVLNIFSKQKVDGKRCSCIIVYIVIHVFICMNSQENTFSTFHSRSFCPVDLRPHFNCTDTMSIKLGGPTFSNDCNWMQTQCALKDSCWSSDQKIHYLFYLPPRGHLF